MSQGRLRGRCHACYREAGNTRRRLQKQQDPEAFRQKVQAQLNKRRDKARAYSREYRAKNPEKYGEQSRRRRAQRLNNGFAKYSEKEMLETYGTSCHLCGSEVDLSAPRQCGKYGWELGLHVDHVLPIAQGGPDTLENVRPAHAKCNISRSKTI